MNRRVLIVSTLAFLATGVFVRADDRPSPDEQLVQQVLDLQQVTGDPQFVMVPMRDGVKLWTSIWKPSSSGKLPTILIRTPYWPDQEVQHRRILASLARSGYAIVVQNERGSFLSEGKFRIMGGARDDGYDAIDWVSKQPWSNGRVGTFGCSSSGDNQVPLAAMHHPAHVAMITAASGSSIGRVGPFQEQGLIFRGGALQIGPWVPWYRSVHGLTYQLKLPPDADADTIQYYGQHYRKKPEVAAPTLDYLTMERVLPIQNATRAAGGGPSDYDYLWRMQPNDPRFEQEPLFNADKDDIGVPGLWVTQVFDVGIQPMFAAFEHARAKSRDAGIRANQFAIVSPLTHCAFGLETEHTVIGQRQIGDARFDYTKVFTDWFDYWVKDGKKPNAGAFKRPAVETYLPGRDRWQSFDTWPPPTRSLNYYLTSDGHANSRQGTGRLVSAALKQASSDTLIYDPKLPVPTTGGDSCCSPVPGGSVDQSEVEMRNDVLVYTSEPLERALDVVGWAEVDVFLSSDVPDTDLTAKLIDVDESGRALNVGESIQRVRWRDGYKSPVFMKPGKIYQVRVGPFLVSNHFVAGHRIRIDVSSSNFPRYDRNLNTGGNNVDESEPHVARNTVHYGPSLESRVQLPVVEVR
jgi:putative CocE/NonD family hydrolase